MSYEQRLLLSRSAQRSKRRTVLLRCGLDQVLSTNLCHSGLGEPAHRRLLEGELLERAQDSPDPRADDAHGRLGHDSDWRRTGGLVNSRLFGRRVSDGTLVADANQVEPPSVGG